MSLTRINPMGINPSTRFMGKRTIPKAGAQSVAFTGINYGKAVKSLHLKEFWPELKKFWSGTRKTASHTKPFFKGLDSMLRSIGKTVWGWIKPVAT